MDAKTGIAGQIEGKDIIVAIFCQSSGQHTVKFSLCPRPVNTGKAPPLQLYRELVI